MTAIVEAALRRWGLTGASHRLAAARENVVYEVSLDGARYALRIHRRGYRTDQELTSELAWMAAVAGVIGAPAPVPTPDGQTLAHIDGVQADMLTWLDGQMLADVFPAATPEWRSSIFDALGGAMARLHDASDAWTPPSHFERARWDRDGLLGDAPLWDRFWDNPGLTPEDQRLAHAFRQAASERLAAIGPDLEFGLIHADLVLANVLVDGDAVKLIDFDDGGYGWRVFDIATALLKHRAAADYAALERALITGYRRIRAINLSELKLFLALRAATYVGWNITRMAELNGAERNTRFITDFRDTAGAYLALRA